MTPNRYFLRWTGDRPELSKFGRVCKVVYLKKYSSSLLNFVLGRWAAFL